MPSINELYESPFLKGEDLQQNGVPRTAKIVITNYELNQAPGRDGGAPKTQLVLHFNGRRKNRFGLNSGNAKMLGTILGDDYAQWIGQTVHLRGVYKPIGRDMKWLIEVYDPRAFADPLDLGSQPPAAPAAAPAPGMRPGPVQSAPRPQLPAMNDFGGGDQTPVVNGHDDYLPANYGNEGAAQPAGQAGDFPEDDIPF